MKAIKRMTFLIVLILASLVTVVGQSPPDSPQEEPVVVSTNLVTVSVIVTDKKGRYAKGLKADQFSIYDENARQKIAHFASENSSNLSLSYRKGYRRANVKGS